MTQATQAALTHQIDLELTQEEIEDVTARAETVGFDFETYVRVRVLSGEGLPEPAAFFALFRRLSAFAADYEACLRALADRHPAALDRPDELAPVFAQLLQDWDDLYGPRD